MRRIHIFLSAITIGGVGLFLMVIVALHLTQTGYDPLSQLMSELALGKHGQYLLVAFLALAAAIAAISINLLSSGSPIVLAVLLGLASASFASAGWFNLGLSIAVHVGFVAAAFVLCGLSMYLLPIMSPEFSIQRYRIASWCCCAAMAAFATLGGTVIAPGVAQRLAAAALLVWLVMVSWRLSRQ